MLVLTRKEGQVVGILDGLVQVKVIEVGTDGTVKLGFIAPPEVPILRGEAKNRRETTCK